MQNLHDKTAFAPHLAALSRECGWCAVSPGAFGAELYVQTFKGGMRAGVQRFENAQGRRLALVGLEQWASPPRQELYARFLAFPLEVRMVLSALERLAPADWLVLITDADYQLFRLPEEICVYRGEHAEVGELTSLLMALGHGREASVWTGPPHVAEADALGGWLRHWSLELGSTLELRPAEIEHLLWKWILVLQHARLNAGGLAAGNWGLACERLGDVWSVSYDALSSGSALAEALVRASKLFYTTLLDGDLEIQRSWLERLEETTLLERLRAELLMQPALRFQAETAAWLFTDMEHEQEGWRRELLGLEPVRKRLQHDGWTIYRPLVCDLARHGLTTALRDAERVAQYLAELDAWHEQQLQSGAATAQPDLFCPQPHGIDSGGRLADGINFLYGEALRLQGVSDPPLRNGAGLCFLLKALALANELDWPLTRIDTLELLFEAPGR